MFTQSFIAVACIAWMTLLFTLSVVVWVLDWWSSRRDRVVARRRRERRGDFFTRSNMDPPSPDRLPQRASDVTFHAASISEIQRAERRRRARLTGVRR